jgi:hypothetical protein
VTVKLCGLVLVLLLTQSAYGADAEHPRKPLDSRFLAVYEYDTGTALAAISVDRDGALVFGAIDRQARFFCIGSRRLAQLTTLRRRLDGRGGLARGRPFRKAVGQELTVRARGGIFQLVTERDEPRRSSAAARRLVRFLHVLRTRNHSAAKAVPEGQAGELC